MTSATPRPQLRALSSFLERQPTPTREREGRGLGRCLLLFQALPSHSLAHHGAPAGMLPSVFCARAGVQGRGLGTLWTGGCLWFWSPLLALWRAFGFPGEE